MPRKRACSASDSMAVYYTPPPPAQKKGSGPPRECNRSNPICGGTGNKYQREIDYVGAGVFPLRFERQQRLAGRADARRAVADPLRP